MIHFSHIWRKYWW